jgi:hypothetical protein
VPVPRYNAVVIPIPIRCTVLLCSWLVVGACSSTAAAGTDGAAAPPAAAPPAGAQEPAPAQPGAAKPAGAQDAQKQQDERKQKEKELLQKRRDLEYAQVAVETAAIERQIRTMSVEAALQRTGIELTKATRQLEVFRTQQKPRELEEKRISLDAQGNYADEAKDELAELEAMYKDDEFAKATKELVIKRSRRQLELADRRLAVARREFELFEQHTLVDREQDLQRKVDDAKLEVEKAKLEQQKSRLDLDVARRQAEDRVRDLERDIGELEQAVAKLAAGGS